MFDFLTDKILPVVVIGLVLGLCVAAGGLAASAVAGGPGSVFGWALLAVVIMAVFSAFFGYMFWDITGLGNPKTGAVMVCIAAAVCTLVLPINTLINGHKEASFHREIAPKLQSFVLIHFDEIDADHDGTITDGEMTQALKQLRLSGEERNLLAYMRAQQSDVGHVTSSYTQTTWVWISTGNGGGYMSPIITTHYVYGINRDDLTGYPDRMTEKYKKW